MLINQLKNNFKSGYQCPMAFNEKHDSFNSGSEQTKWVSKLLLIQYSIFNLFMYQNANVYFMAFSHFCWYGGPIADKNVKCVQS